MASIKLGPAIAAIAGSIGGTVFSHNKAGPYIRNRSIPINPNTARQVKVKAAMAFLTAEWANALTAAQRTAWNLYASSVTMPNRLGDAINHSGFNHFIRSNMIRKQVDLAIISNGPTIFEIPAQDPTLAITCTEAGLTISVTFDITMDWAIEDGGFLLVFQGSPQNPQINFFKGPYRFMNKAVGADPGPLISPIVMPAVFVVTEGQHQFVYARIARADGRLSEPFEADVFCGA